MASWLDRYPKSFAGKEAWENRFYLIDRDDITRLPIMPGSADTELTCAIKIAARSLPWYTPQGQWYGFFWAFM